LNQLQPQIVYLPHSQLGQEQGVNHGYVGILQSYVFMIMLRGSVPHLLWYFQRFPLADVQMWKRTLFGPDVSRQPMELVLYLLHRMVMVNVEEFANQRQHAVYAGPAISAPVISASGGPGMIGCGSVSAIPKSAGYLGGDRHVCAAGQI
jgi:hypothetical protein